MIGEGRVHAFTDDALGDDDDPGQGQHRGPRLADDQRHRRVHAPPGDERTLLELAYAVEADRPWRRITDGHVVDPHAGRPAT